MSTARACSRITTGALTVTLTAGVLVATTVPVATAGSGSTTYTCDFPGVGALPVPVSTTVPDLPETPAGAPIPAGSLNPAFVFDTTNLGGVLALVTSPSATGMALGVGDQSVPVQGFAFGTPSGSSLPASATSGAFTAPATPGVYDVTMPGSFDFTGLLGGNPVSAPCVTDAPAVLGTLTALPGEEPGLSGSTTEATLAKKRILKGKKAKVTAEVTLTPIPAPAMGEVVVKKRRKTIGTGTLQSGTVTIRTTAFKKPGRYTLKVKYLGEDMLVSGSKDTVVLRVKRRR